MSTNDTQSSTPHIIEVPGDVLVRRSEFAEATLRVCNRTAARMNLPTVYIGGIAYVARNASLKMLADRVSRHSQQRQRRVR